MIFALQYHAGDLDRTMSLARLLADLEPLPRLDVLLALVCQPGTPRTELVARTVAHCRRRFPVVEVTSAYGAQGHPRGCTALWRGTATHFYQKYQDGSLVRDIHTNNILPKHFASLLMLDGGDGVPLHPQWLDMMIEKHLETLKYGKLITGTPYFLGTCPLHVNPNAVFELRLFKQAPHLLEDVPHDGTLLTNFDVYHREVMLKNARLSSVVRTDWRGGGRPATLELLRERSARALWLHGYKDENLYRLAREHLSSDPPPPQICRYSIEQLRVQEKIRRDYEKAGR
jgi:hypothetical protein